MRATLFASEVSEDEKKHFIMLSFDDGFKKSSIRTAEIYGKYHLSACINVIATAIFRALNSPMNTIAGL